MKSFCSIGLLVIVMSMSAEAMAATTSFRCRNDLVNVGDSKASTFLW